MVFTRKVTTNQQSEIFYRVFTIQLDFLISFAVEYAYFKLKC